MDLNNKTIIRSAVVAVNRGDVKGYLKNFSSSCLRWIAGFDQPMSLADVGDHLSQLIEAFDPLRLDEELLIADDQFVCARWQLRGTQVGAFMGMPSHGNSIDVATCEIYKIADGMVIESWVYQDPGQLFAQMAAGSGADSSL
ncbi:MAG TPA: ester cyclase [Acidimicrobiales bacterium]